MDPQSGLRLCDPGVTLFPDDGLLIFHQTMLILSLFLTVNTVKMLFRMSSYSPINYDLETVYSLFHAVITIKVFNFY